MNKKLRFSGGEPNINIDDVLRDSDALRDFLNDWLNEICENPTADTYTYILSGCTLTTPAGSAWSTTSGYVVIDGEILKVDAHTGTRSQGTDFWVWEKETTYDSNGTKTFNDTVSRDTWQKNRAVLTNKASALGGTHVYSADDSPSYEYYFIEKNIAKIASELQGNTWTDMGSLLNGWTATTAKYRVDKEGYLEVFFEALNPSSATASVIFSLPAGSRPDYIMYKSASNATTSEEISVSSSGNIYITNYSSLGGTVSVHLRIPRLHP